MLNKADQETLYASLARRNEKLARVYRGALMVLADENNPCRHELAAHGFRELIEKSPWLTNGEAVVTGDGLKNRLGPVRSAFSVVVRNREIEEPLSLNGIEGPLRSLISELETFFQWQDMNRPKAAVRAAKNLSILAGAGPPLPSDIFETEVAGWMSAQKYFQAVAHNQFETIDPEEFLRCVNFVETTLLRRLQPRSIEQLNELDALIKGAEDGD